MKKVRIVFIVISIVLLFVIVYAIINSEVIYKYEIEGRNGDKVDVLWVGDWVKETIKVWRSFFCYVVVNIVFLMISVLKKNK